MQVGDLESVAVSDDDILAYASRAVRSTGAVSKSNENIEESTKQHGVRIPELLRSQEGKLFPGLKNCCKRVFL